MVGGESMVVVRMERAIHSLYAPSQYVARSSRESHITAVVSEGVTAKELGNFMEIGFHESTGSGFLPIKTSYQTSIDYERKRPHGFPSLENFTCSP